MFVAVLPCSYYTYAEACDDMKTENWLNCHVHAFDYFGGVARLLIPDNCKTATLSNTRYDVILNRSYQELAEHYGTASYRRVSASHGTKVRRRHLSALPKHGLWPLCATASSFPCRN